MFYKKTKPLDFGFRQSFIRYRKTMLNSAIVLWDSMKTYEDNILTFIHELFTVAKKADKKQWAQSFSTSQREFIVIHQRLFKDAFGVIAPAGCQLLGQTVESLATRLIGVAVYDYMFLYFQNTIDGDKSL
jgi:hypothetical protein